MKFFRTAGTLGSVSMNVCTLFFGILLDKYGTFVCRSAATVIISIGLLFLLFTPKVHWFLFVGMILYTAPTFSLLVSNQPIAFLFPKFAAFIMVFGQWGVRFKKNDFKVILGVGPFFNPRKRTRFRNRHFSLKTKIYNNNLYKKA